MKSSLIFLSLGSNLKNRLLSLTKALTKIRALPNIEEFRCSKVYETSPVSDIDQNHFFNCVCSFRTTLKLEALFENLQRIEKDLGKSPKPKNAPRIIDIDILFYGNQYRNSSNLKVPHQDWKNRLFVLIPLLDLEEILFIPNENGSIDTFSLKEYLKNFPNPYNEQIPLYVGDFL